MTNVSRRSRGKKRGKSKNKEFMDAALDAFIRDQSLQKWNEVQGLKAGAEVDQKEAVKSSSEFFKKGQYRDIWQRWWQNEVIETGHDNHEHLFAKIENAVRGAVLEERELRKQQPDSLLEDSNEYKEFIARQMDHLLFEAGGEIEEEV
ncbi:MAG: hypothetical protein QGI65_03925 [SAR324 cluster bacterium]|jgi:hypothetical protein|nr:hypothetical protein [SAR324 cluster bacterium]MDP6522229.1 hypothetical protein [SAR324 cluster bacterium]MDP7620670.1 hypothetical protein [SAR324 cluster bacterium]|tara:strand:+ start:256 stop:699 length:444 start_codon:yes stop_codon:yes gene_type:complete